MAYYTVDFKAGGYGIAFGQPATTNGFVCAMPTTFTGNSTVTFAGDANFTNTLKYKGSHVVTNVAYDTTNKKLTKTVNNVATDIATAIQIVQGGDGFRQFPWQDSSYTDLNNILWTGWSIISAAAVGNGIDNFPPTSHGGYFVSYYWSDSFVNQLFYPRETTDSVFYWRKKASGNWGSWYLVGQGVMNVAYDSTNKKITKTIGSTTSDVVTVSTLSSALGLGNKLDITNGQETSNLNNCKTAGFYTYTSDCSNKPTSVAVGGSLLVMRYSATYMYQIAFANSTSTSDSTTKDASQMRIYARRYYNGNWYPSNSWYKISMS